MLDKKELNEKIEAFVSFSKEEKLNKEKNKLKEVEDLLKKSFIDGSFSTGDYKYFINYIGLKNLENKVIKTKNAGYIYSFAEYVNGANNIEKLENSIIETKDAWYIYLFAKDVKGANIEKLENAIIEINNPSLISFMRKVLDDKEMTDSEIQMAKRKYIFSLLDNIGENDNGVMLGMYLGCLISPESTVEDLEKCNEAYLNYMRSREKEQTNNKKK